MEDHPSLKALQALTHAVERGRRKAIEAAEIAVALGHLLIGTARLDVEIHEPPPPQTTCYFDIERREWVYSADDQQPVLRATDAPYAALMCALFGDYNERGQRRYLPPPNGPLTDLPPPHFGWSKDGTELHAIPELLAEVEKRGVKLVGSIDVIEKDDSFLPVRFETGHHLSHQSHKTLAHIPVNGTDLPLGRIQQVRYDLKR